MPKKIRVHERALAHLSRGLYRSPASAIRELVSNAWDANATNVSIDTNFPKFFQLSIEDNGDGFGRADFDRLMGGGIGNSEKRSGEKALKFGRPTIGRLGIGMLGIAQICGSFVVTSRPKTGKGFRARVQLYDLAKSEMDKPKSGLVHDATTTLSDDEQIPSKIIDVGTFDFIDVGDEIIPFGTRIVADDVHPTFVQTFQESLNLEGFKKVPLEWKTAVSTLNNSSSLQLLGDYWRLLWELSASCPIPYLANDAVPKGVVKKMNTQLQSYNFSLVVDGRQLFKPALMKANPGGYTVKSISRETTKVYGQPLTFSGYIVVQEGKQIKPDEMRGVIIRIKNVGIGYYDASMLDYPINEGPRSRWVTGEIFVEEGLEDALNVDRDSFNRFHPEFRTLQKRIHSILQDDIFPEVYKKIEVRSEKRRKEVSSKRDKVLRRTVRQETEQTVKITRRTVESESVDAVPVYSSSHRNKNAIEVVVSKAEDLPTSKASRQLAQSILTLFELAIREKGEEAQRQKFSELLFVLLKSW